MTGLFKGCDRCLSSVEVALRWWHLRGSGEAEESTTKGCDLCARLIHVPTLHQERHNRVETKRQHLTYAGLIVP
jgi:hypothetical protein